MNKIYTTNLNLPQIDAGLLILRLGAGALILTHGIPKLLNLFSGEEIVFADPFGLGMEFTLLLAVLAEFLCAVLIIVGLGTRLAAIPLILTMFTAAFIVHAEDPFQRKELAVLYLVAFVVVTVAGAGKYSLDYAWQKKSK